MPDLIRHPEAEARDTALVSRLRGNDNETNLMKN